MSDTQLIDQNINPEPKPWGMEEKQFTVFMHVAQFAGFIIPFAGIVLPIVMWSSNKDESMNVDQHGKNIVNFIISLFIYTISSALLCLLFIGFILLPIVLLIGFVFPIIGAIKASNGEVFNYPLSIKFIK